MVHAIIGLFFNGILLSFVMTLFLWCLNQMFVGWKFGLMVVFLAIFAFLSLMWVVLTLIILIVREYTIKRLQKQWSMYEDKDREILKNAIIHYRLLEEKDYKTWDVSQFKDFYASRRIRITSVLTAD